MKLLIEMNSKLSSKRYHLVKEKRIIYDAVLKFVTKGIRGFSFFSRRVSC